MKMTEWEWLTTNMPLYMLRQYPAAWDEKKAFLAGSHCLRHGWHLLSDLQRHYLEAVERVAEGEGSARETKRLLGELAEAARQPGWYFNLPDHYAYRAVRSFSHRPSQDSLINIFSDIAHCAGYVAAESEEKEWQCQLIREIFGNPFRPVHVGPSWLTSDVLALARGIYNENAFDRMPILADALQDAGCNNVNVLDHCRQPGEHVRGCWVIDLLV